MSNQVTILSCSGSMACTLALPRSGQRNSGKLPRPWLSWQLQCLVRTVSPSSTCRWRTVRWGPRREHLPFSWTQPQFPYFTHETAEMNREHASSRSHVPPNQKSHSRQPRILCQERSSVSRFIVLVEVKSNLISPDTSFQKDRAIAFRHELFTKKVLNSL